MTEQTVAQPSDADRKGSEPKDEGAQDTLDKLLNEWESDRQQQQTTQPQKTEAVDDEVREWVREQKREKAQQSLEQGIQKSVSTVKEIVGDDLTDAEIEDMLWGRAAKDMRFQNAFLNRGIDPTRWERTLKSLGAELRQRRATKPDKEATEDREAVAAAVRSAATRATEPDNQDFSNVKNMSTAQFETWLKSLKPG